MKHFPGSCRLMDGETSSILRPYPERSDQMKHPAIKFLSFFLVLGMLISICGCSGIRLRKDPDPNGGSGGEVKSYEAVLSPKEIKPFSSSFTSGLNRYGFDVLLDLYDGKNIAVSPASLELALLMTAMGATAKTGEEMFASLQMSGLSKEEVLESVAQLMWRANNNSMEAANSLWLQDGYGFAQKYLDICGEDFMADLYTVDYENAAADATERINEWAEDKTHGKIEKILDEDLDDSTRLVLVNALYFLGDWATPFEANSTWDDTFHGASGDSEVPFMHSEWDVSYYDGKTFQLIILPFLGDDGQVGPFAMSFILPKEGCSPEDVAEEMTEEGFETLIKEARSVKVQISLPKFEFEYGTSMVDTMKALGMKEAFSGSAQFDEMTGGENDLFVSNIIHKTYIRVDEEGAEAAAVTAVISQETAMPIDEPDPIVFNADHPFLFTIYDTTDGTMLFTGITADLG